MRGDLTWVNKQSCFFFSLLSSASSGEGGSETLLHLFPVDNLPNFFEEFGSRVLVIEIVSVLPNIHVEKRSVGSWTDSILVTRGHNLKLLGLLAIAQPGPAGSLNGSSNSRELSLELINTSKVGLDHVEKLSFGWLFAAITVNRGQTLPEELVVEMTSTVELDVL